MSGSDRNRPGSSADWLLGDQRPRDRPKTIDLAIDAWTRARTAFGENDLPQAAYWAERAARLGPDDTQVRFLLGLVRLRQQNPAAIGIFSRLAELSDTAPVHRALAAATLLQPHTAERVRAVAALLSRFTPPDDAEFPALAARVAAEGGFPGWCGADGAGRVILAAPGTPTFLLDESPIPLRRRADGTLLLPQSWTRARSFSVHVDGRPLLGSPVDLERRRLVEGFVEARPGDAGGLSGWAWSPADPDAALRLVLTTADGRQAALAIGMNGPATFPNMDGLAVPKAFRIPAARLAGRTGLLHLRDPWGRDLTGSPIDPRQWGDAAALAARLVAGFRPVGRAASDAAPVLPIWADTPRPARPAAVRPSRLAPAVVIPAYRGAGMTRQCLARVLETVPQRAQVIVIDDASPEPLLSDALSALARTRRIKLIRNTRNLGFPASANLGIAAAGRQRDVVLLNSDAIVPDGWLERLQAAAWSAPDIGTVAPLSNDATILSYPRAGSAQPPPEPKMLARIDRMAARANGGLVVDIPTSVGFCMYIRRDCLTETGMLREDVFAQGYGEENDFCLRARHLGWRHVAAAGVFVSHIGGQSFRAARAHLLRRNLDLLERLHPGYHGLIAAHVAADPLAEARRRLDLARWRALRGRAPAAPSVILITHGEGGGVERQVRARARALAGGGFRPIILRPGAEGACSVTPGAAEDDIWRHDFPNLRYHIPEELPALTSLLRREAPAHVELHHQLGHNPALLTLAERLGVPMDVFVHDYATICPRISLVTTTRRYCGEPETAQCEACVADLGSRLREEITVAALRARTARELAAARRVVFPSADAAKRLRRYVPRLRAEITPWEEDAALPARRSPSPRAGASRRWRIAVIGAIGTEKGYDVVLDCARDAERRGLPLEFVVIGYTHDDKRLIDTGRVKITYKFALAEAVPEIAAQMADIAFIPSIWPETWCFALSDAWAAGLRTAVFDIGTQAERVRATSRGWVLPLALPTAALNDTLIMMVATGD